MILTESILFVCFRFIKFVITLTFIMVTELSGVWSEIVRI